MWSPGPSIAPLEQAVVPARPAGRNHLHCCSETATVGGPRLESPERGGRRISRRLRHPDLT
eukprot:5162518-Alexandrium_andersonii.AAC.1